MELSILDTCGLPDGSILSVRSGATRRQSPLPCSTPFKLPGGPWPLRIDVLALLGKSPTGASIAKPDADGRCRVPLEASDGRKMSVTLQVFEGKAGMRPNTAPSPVANRQGTQGADAEGAETSPVRRRDTEAEARAYLDRHRLHEFMHTLFELLLRERPADPYSFIAERFREAARLESPNVPAALTTIAGAQKPTRSIVSTAPTSSPTVHRDEVVSPSHGSPHGGFQVTVRNMRGRNLARIAAEPDMRISELKEQLAASLGVPATSQQLLWWAETMPNGTTLRDHAVPADGVTVHLVCGTREPRLRRALSGSSDGGLKLWSLEDCELIRDFGCGGPSAVLAVSVHWESMRAVAGCLDGGLQLWDLEAGKCVRSWTGHSEEVSALEVDWAGMRALSGAFDGTVMLWNLNEDSCSLVLAGGSTIYSLAVHWSEMKACGGLRSGLVRLWSLTTGAHLRDINIGAAAAIAAGTAVSSVAIDCIGQRALSGLEDGHLAYWHFGTHEEGTEAAAAPTPKTKVLLAHYRAVRTISARWTPSDSRALCGSDDGSLSLWHLDSQTCIARFGRHVGYVWTLCTDWARERAMSGAFDGCIKLWDLRTGDCLHTLQGHSRPVRSIAAG